MIFKEAEWRGASAQENPGPSREPLGHAEGRANNSYGSPHKAGEYETGTHHHGPRF